MRAIILNTFKDKRDRGALEGLLRAILGVETVAHFVLLFAESSAMSI